MKKQQETPHNAEYFMGIDLSTQQLKGIIVDKASNFGVVSEHFVHFDTELQHYRTVGGAHLGEDGVTVTAPVLMWVEALDVLFEKFQQSGFRLENILCISGTAQQHGSVYWKKQSEHIMQKANYERKLAQILQNADSFVVKNSPIWMDSSTEVECQQLALQFGHEYFPYNTGSKLQHRFTASQILKLVKTDCVELSECEQISLISSFIASLLIGKYSPVELSDACGMNLLNLAKKQWDSKILDFISHAASNCAARISLRDLLLPPIPSFTVLDSISDYFRQRYGFSSLCQVASFTGDNLASFAGLRMTQNDVCLSLGTSDTVFLSVDEIPSHRAACQDSIYLLNPIQESGFMALLCFKNGSLLRESFRDEFCHKDWALFEECLQKTNPGNDGHLGIYFEAPEIIPSLSQGIFRWDPAGRFLGRDSRISPLKFPSISHEIRALLEGQFLAKRYHAEISGCRLSKKSRIFVTGGGSMNLSIMKMISNIFGAPVYRIHTSNSAALGSCYRAAYAHYRHHLEKRAPEMSYFEFTQSVSPPLLVAEPCDHLTSLYSSMLKRYIACETSLSSAV